MSAIINLFRRAIFQHDNNVLNSHQKRHRLTRDELASAFARELGYRDTSAK